MDLSYNVDDYPFVQPLKGSQNYCQAHPQLKQSWFEHVLFPVVTANHPSAGIVVLAMGQPP